MILYKFVHLIMFMANNFGNYQPNLSQTRLKQGN